jgi:hypothetical protein
MEIFKISEPFIEQNVPNFSFLSNTFASISMIISAKVTFCFLLITLFGEFVLMQGG